MEFSHVAQCQGLKLQAVEAYYRAVNDVAKGSYAGRLGARIFSPVITAAEMLFQLAMNVATLAETIFKGIGNGVFGAVMLEKKSALRGLRQLFVNLPLQIVDFIPTIVIQALCFVPAFICVTVTPIEAAESLADAFKEDFTKDTRLKDGVPPKDFQQKCRKQLYF